METTISVMFIAIAVVILVGGAAVTIYKKVHNLRADGTPRENK